MLLCLTAIAMSGPQEVTGIKKKTDKFNLYLNMHGDFNMKWNESGFDQGAFEMKQLRIEMKGNINDWLSYRYRQRLNRGNDGSGNIVSNWISFHSLPASNALLTEESSLM